MKRFFRIFFFVIVLGLANSIAISQDRVNAARTICGNRISTDPKPSNALPAMNKFEFVGRARDLNRASVPGSQTGTAKPVAFAIQMNKSEFVGGRHNSDESGMQQIDKRIVVAPQMNKAELVGA